MPDLSAETNYELVTLEDGRFGVRVSEANRLPRVIDGFDSEQEAEAKAAALKSEEGDTEISVKPKY